MAERIPPRLLLPDAPSLVAGVRRAVWLWADGEIAELATGEAAERARHEAPLVCHVPATARRLGIAGFTAFDVLELFAFARPARFTVPTPRGLAEALGQRAPDEPRQDLAAQAASLRRIATALLAALAAGPASAATVQIALAMAAAGWSWGPVVLAALGVAPDTAPTTHRITGYGVWDRLPAWSDEAPPGAPGNQPVMPEDARRRLAELTGPGAEARPQQADYASALTAAFQPRERAAEPWLVLAEAGTGVGKTLGYIAPASLWAEKNRAPVWISTYTRNLQRQIDGELDRLYDAASKPRRVVIRKGRENYLCLLNYEEAVRAAALRPRDAIGLGMTARWAEVTRDGSLVGGDFPAWLVDLVGPGQSLGLADRRGECVYAACAHYAKCFVERSWRGARHADIVVANHALVMVQAALGGLDDAYLPSRYVFDEGHHLFDAADAAFSAALTGGEAAELRRWLLGAEGGRSRARGLKRRVEDLVADDAQAAAALDAALTAGHGLPGDGWLVRLGAERPEGPAERFLASVRQQVLARALETGGPHGVETETRPTIHGLIERAQELGRALDALIGPLAILSRRLLARLDAGAGELDSATRLRIEGIARTLHRRGDVQLQAWRRMLAALDGPTPPLFVDWFAVERSDGRELDVGMHRHWIDPTEPFVESVARPAHGVAITSATLTDGTGDVEADWTAAEARTGGPHLARPPIRASVPSPFDYAKQTRVFVVTDVRKEAPGQVAAAYRELFLAAGGGALGLFTAIQRLRAVHGRIAGELEEKGLTLLAQHVDRLDVSTLIDIFRAERDACLLGTDAVRDGIDVPGRALRLIVFDRVPWPRPDILHKARRIAFGGAQYDAMVARMRLRQAFGRLVRRADDVGVFVLLDRMAPSRILAGLPAGAVVARVGLAEAVRATREFLATST
ncbi:MAG: ATP-dependent DNA helicase [Alphaproteobacteria bacterium]|nr:ATP-dependent DNA helicase [Alphaproteobacteria bacterium]